MEEAILKQIIAEAVNPLVEKIEELTNKLNELQSKDNVLDINILPTSQARKILGYSSNQALTRAIADETFVEGKHWLDYRKKGSKKPDYRFKIKECKQRLNKLSKERALINY